MGRTSHTSGSGNDCEQSSTPYPVNSFSSQLRALNIRRVTTDPRRQFKGTGQWRVAKSKLIGFTATWLLRANLCLSPVVRTSLMLLTTFCSVSSGYFEARALDVGVGVNQLIPLDISLLISYLLRNKLI